MKTLKQLKQLKQSALKINANVIEHADMLFLNFSKDGSYTKAQEWGKENGLFQSTKEDIESIKNDDLPAIFGKTYGYIVETTGQVFSGDAGACCVWFVGSLRRSSLRWQYYFGGGYDWFCFRKSLDTTTLGTLDPLSLEKAIQVVKEAGYKLFKEY